MTAATAVASALPLPRLDFDTMKVRFPAWRWDLFVASSADGWWVWVHPILLALAALACAALLPRGRRGPSIIVLSVAALAWTALHNPHAYLKAADLLCLGPGTALLAATRSVRDEIPAIRSPVEVAVLGAGLLLLGSLVGTSPSTAFSADTGLLHRLARAVPAKGWPVTVFEILTLLLAVVGALMAASPRRRWAWVPGLLWATVAFFPVASFLHVQASLQQEIPFHVIPTTVQLAFLLAAQYLPLLADAACLGIGVRALLLDLPRPEPPLVPAR